MLASTPRPAELFPSPAMQSDHSAQILGNRKFTGQRALFHASSRPVTTLSTFSGAHCHRSTAGAIRRTLAQRRPTGQAGGDAVDQGRYGTWFRILETAPPRF